MVPLLKQTSASSLVADFLRQISSKETMLQRDKETKDVIKIVCVKKYPTGSLQHLR